MLKSSRAISRVNAELKTDVFEVSSGQYTLLMETEEISETSVFILENLENFSIFIRCERFKFYIKETVAS
jgi:hypothetical protein